MGKRMLLVLPPDKGRKLFQLEFCIADSKAFQSLNSDGVVTFL
jgi:hypothetical protein